MKRYYYITTSIIMLIVSFIGITYSYEYNGDDTIKFELIGPQLYMWMLILSIKSMGLWLNIMG